MRRDWPINYWRVLGYKAKHFTGDVRRLVEVLEVLEVRPFTRMFEVDCPNPQKQKGLEQWTLNMGLCQEDRNWRTKLWVCNSQRECTVIGYVTICYMGVSENKQNTRLIIILYLTMQYWGTSPLKSTNTCPVVSHVGLVTPITSSQS